VAAMVTAYVVLDGFDLGAGTIYLAIAKTDEERRRMLRAIGPVWDGNELWLIAAASTLHFAFPEFCASILSGFYSPLRMVLGFLLLRLIGVELRRRAQSGPGQKLLDAIFSVSSILLTVSFGLALGNLVRGVPLDANGHFFEPLWTTFQLGDQ